MEIDHIHAFGWRKIRRMIWDKNKAVTQRLGFHFCLKTAEKKSKSRKKITMLLQLWNYRKVVKIFLGYF